MNFVFAEVVGENGERPTVACHVRRPPDDWGDHHHPITPSPHHTITPAEHHTITPSHHHTITPSHHHTITSQRLRPPHRRLRALGDAEKEVQLAAQAAGPGALVVLAAHLHHVQQVAAHAVALLRQDLLQAPHVAQFLAPLAGAHVQVDAPGDERPLLDERVDGAAAEPERRAHHPRKAEDLGVLEK